MAAVVASPQVGWAFSRLAGALPSGSLFPAKQLDGSWPANVIWPKSELDGFPKKPLCTNVLSNTASPCGSKTHPKPDTANPPVPLQVWPSTGVPRSG